MANAPEGTLDALGPVALLQLLRDKDVRGGQRAELELRHLRHAIGGSEPGPDDLDWIKIW